MADTEAELRALEVDIQEGFVANGLQNMKVDGRTVYLRKEFRATAAVTDESVAAFVESGLGSLVRPAINSQTLTSYVRERREAGEDIPDAVMQYVNIIEGYRVSARSAK